VKENSTQREQGFRNSQKYEYFVYDNEKPCYRKKGSTMDLSLYNKERKYLKTYY